MSINITLRKGLDINIEGEASKTLAQNIKIRECAIIPDDFPGFMPKVEVKEGDTVMSGSPLLHDKAHDSIKLVSPVAGTVKAVARGERRKIERIVITPDGTDKAVKFDINPNGISRDGAKTLLQESGLWVMMRQRPYDIVPSPEATPRDIFVTGFDSAPLAPDFNFILDGKDKEINTGLELLSKLTDGKVYVSLRTDKPISESANIVKVLVSGAHPAGNAGIQAANIAPINKGETVWTLDIVTVARMGALVLTGSVPMETVIALTGSEACSPHYMTTVIGAAASPLLEGNINDNGRHLRIISGNVLTGHKIAADGYLRYPYRQLTVIPEGDDVDEFLGWATLSPKKMSVSRSFIGHFLKSRKFVPDARILGGRRAMIMSGEYDKVLPMDIIPEYLFKAIISRNIDDMEKLGIYEIAPEDVALCEYVDTSKLELQKIVREGLDYLRNELE